MGRVHKRLRPVPGLQRLRPVHEASNERVGRPVRLVVVYGPRRIAVVAGPQGDGADRLVRHLRHDVPEEIGMREGGPRVRGAVHVGVQRVHDEDPVRPVVVGEEAVVVRQDLDAVRQLVRDLLDPAGYHGREAREVGHLGSRRKSRRGPQGRLEGAVHVVDLHVGDPDEGVVVDPVLQDAREALLQLREAELRVHAEGEAAADGLRLPAELQGERDGVHVLGHGEKDIHPQRALRPQRPPATRHWAVAAQGGPGLDHGVQHAARLRAAGARPPALYLPQVGVQGVRAMEARRVLLHLAR
mmetsp:Transcript_69753/g.215703  ORF Transcript_69753/g.215703 Transcript_69753/m.215703 type:complete len:299 (+) Transcript_69753:257-1153(+)